MQGPGLGLKFDLGIPEGGGQVWVYAVDLQRQPAGQLIAAALLMDQGLADQMLKPRKQCGVDLCLDLLAAQAALALEAEHQRRAPACRASARMRTVGAH